MIRSRCFRTKKQAGLLIGLWGAAIALYVVLDASPIIAGLIIIVSLPALYDFMRADIAELEVNQDHIKWRWRKHEHQVPLTQIDYVQLTTRLDFSLRMTLVLTSGQKLRVIDPCVIGNAQDLEAAFTTLGLLVKRSHFTLI
jgi:hypothetical protein